MPKRLTNGKELSQFEADANHQAPLFQSRSSKLYHEGKLDTDAYFKFLDEYWSFLTAQGLAGKKREPIIIKNPIF